MSSKFLAAGHGDEIQTFLKEVRTVVFATVPSNCKKMSVSYVEEDVERSHAKHFVHEVYLVPL